MTDSLFDTDIRHSVFIAAPCEKVFETITSAAGWNAFFTTNMELDAQPGGRVVWRWTNWGPDRISGEDTATVIEIDPPSHFSFNWHPVGPDHPTTVTMELTPRNAGTVLTLTETNYPDTPKGRATILDCACGWGEALTLLKVYLECGHIYGPVSE